jgi:TonB family protein
MKAVLYFSILPLLSLCCNLYSQSSDDDDLADNSANRIHLSPVIESDLNFEARYEINSTIKCQLKLLADAKVYSDPEMSLSIPGMVIPKDTIIAAYKFLPKDAVWTIRFKEHWGFIPVDKVMPFGESEAFSEAECDEAPLMLSELKINYPAAALINGIKGTVVIDALISRTGAVLQTHIKQSILGLDEAAVASVRELKFKPGTRKGKPVVTWKEIPVLFELNTGN